MFKKFFIVIVLVLMLLPGILFIVEDNQLYAINENRVLTKWPEGGLLTCIKDSGQYASNITDYFNDRFGLRDIMIRTKNEIQYRVFGVTGEDGIYVGKDGYLFYKSVVEKEQIVNERMDDSCRNKIIVSLCKVESFLEDRNIDFLYMFPPQKNEVFPERLINAKVVRPEEDAYDKLIKEIMANDMLVQDFIDVMPLLREAEKTFPTYYRTDFHWNEYGATVAYTPVVNTFAKRSGIKTPIFGVKNYVVKKQDDFQGGQLYNLPLLTQWSETAYYTKKIGECTSYITEEELLNGAVHWINTNEDASLGTVLFIGDSYTHYMLYSESGILDNFKEAYWVHTDNSKYVLDNYSDKVDYVVFERIESGLSSVEYYLNWLSENFES